MNLPDVVAIDANGYWWRVFLDPMLGEEPMWSMVPCSPENLPAAEPVNFYSLVEAGSCDECAGAGGRWAGATGPGDWERCDRCDGRGYYRHGDEAMDCAECEGTGRTQPGAEP